MVKVQRPHPDGPGIDSRWCHWIFQWHIPSDRTMVLGSNQPLVKMSTRNISWGYRRQVPEADNLTTFTCRMSRKSGNLNLLEPSGPHRTCYGTPLPYKGHTINNLFVTTEYPVCRRPQREVCCSPTSSAKSACTWSVTSDTSVVNILFPCIFI
jgi:hypothetical protein